MGCKDCVAGEGRAAGGASRGRRASQAQVGRAWVVAWLVSLSACAAGPSGSSGSTEPTPDGLVFGGGDSAAGAAHGDGGGAVDSAGRGGGSGGPGTGDAGGGAGAVDAGQGGSVDAGHGGDASAGGDAGDWSDGSDGSDGSDVVGEPDAPAGLGVLTLAPPLIVDAHPTANFRGVDGAWDPVAGAFLFAYGNAPIGGAYVDPSGAQVGAGFRLTDAPYDDSNWTQNPRVAPSDGGCLVSWHATLPAGNHVAVRRVRWQDGPAFDGPAVILSGPGPNQESAAALGWAPGIGEHLVVWAQDGLRGRRVAPSGAPVGAELTLSEPGVWVEGSSVAWHPGCGCWFVAFMQVAPPGAHIALVRVGGDGVPLGGALDLTGMIEFAKITDLELDAQTGSVVASWYEVRDGAAGFAAMRVGADGLPQTAAVPVFVPHGSYDGYDLAYSAVTGTSLAAFHGPTIAVWAAELGPDLSNGVPFPLDPGGSTFGAFLPRVVASPEVAAWFVAFTPDYAGVTVQKVVRE